MTKKKENWVVWMTKVWITVLGAPTLVLGGYHIHHDFIGLAVLSFGVLLGVVGGAFMLHHKRTEGWVFIDKSKTKKKWGIIFWIKKK